MLPVNSNELKKVRRQLDNIKASKRGIWKTGHTNSNLAGKREAQDKTEKE